MGVGDDEGAVDSNSKVLVPKTFIGNDGMGEQQGRVREMAEWGRLSWTGGLSALHWVILAEKRSCCEVPWLGKHIREIRCMYRIYM